MAQSIPFGAHSTADQVLAGIDLTRKRIVVTGCSSGTGRIVIVSSDASIKQAPAEGVLFDNLDGQRFYDPFAFYGQAKLAAALYARELSYRLAPRGVSVNSLHPGSTRGTGFDKYRKLTRRLSHRVARLFMKSPAQGAATQSLLAASPQVGGITGEYWSDCQIAQGNPLLADAGLTRRLWETSERIVRSKFYRDASIERSACRW
jgi:WW domain-containing oxidoreductase